MANETALNDFTKDELLGYAEQFGTDVNKSISKKDLVERLTDDGISVALIHGFQKPTEEEIVEQGLQPLAPGELEETAQPAEVEDEDDLVLIKMTRTNFTYEIRGHKFSRTHPFALVKEEDADYLIEVDGGFAMATPKEARAYYS